MPLTKSQIVERLADDGAGGKRQVKHVLDALADLAAEEISNGENFTVPGIASLKFYYAAPLKKGEKYRKGDTYVGFGGVEQVAEADSKARKQSIKLRAAPSPLLKRTGKDPSTTRKAIAKAKK